MLPKVALPAPPQRPSARSPRPPRWPRTSWAALECASKSSPTHLQAGRSSSQASTRGGTTSPTSFSRSTPPELNSLNATCILASAAQQVLVLLTSSNKYLYPNGFLFTIEQYWPSKVLINIRGSPNRRSICILWKWLWRSQAISEQKETLGVVRDCSQIRICSLLPKQIVRSRSLGRNVQGGQSGFGHQSCGSTTHSKYVWHKIEESSEAQFWLICRTFTRFLVYFLQASIVTNIRHAPPPPPQKNKTKQKKQHHWGIHSLELESCRGCCFWRPTPQKAGCHYCEFCLLPS